MPRKRVLVVDDSEVILAVVKATLESGDYEVQTAICWEELNEALRSELPDLILMDVNMPEVHGDFALSFFKEERGLSGTPILLYSDMDVAELEQRALECQADGFVSKSWGTERLVEVVNSYLRPAT